jgi:signal transduction histidine kinase
MLDGVIARDDVHVTLVRREAGRAIQLLEDVAALVRLEQPAAGNGAAAVAADAVAEEMRERLAPLAEAAGVALVTETGPAQVELPPGRLEQLLVNLIRNALRAVQGGGGTRITIFVRRRRASVELGVEDDGPGMSSEERARAFDRFFRGASDGVEAQGSGLGLTIARRIVNAAGGEIAAEPLAPRGLRVVARLPARAEGGTGGGEAPPQAG